MITFEYISFVLNLLVSGSCLVALLTLKSTRIKAGAEAKGAEHDAKGKEIENEEKASKLLMGYIVEPLKNEINALRREIKKLQKSIEKISDCPSADNCPVRNELQNNKNNDE